MRLPGDGISVGATRGRLFLLTVWCELSALDCPCVTRENSWYYRVALR